MARRRFLLWLRAAGSALAVALAGAITVGYVAVHRSVWRPRATVIVEGLRRPARIALDAFGVPYVRAADARDAACVEGYLHARERFYQMEFARRAVAGRVAELVGRAALPLDREMRRLSMARAAARQLAELDADARALLAAYASGVNAALAERGASGLAPEFLVLGGSVEPWREEDSLEIALGIAYTLTGAAGDEQRRAEVLHGLGRKRAVDLWGWTDAQAQAWIPPDLAGKEAPTERLLSPPISGFGSNNWAIAGSRTRSGAPILANDPHVGVANPATWYEIGLDAPDLHVTGASLPGAPGVLIGHNAEVAWGFTMSMVDDQDLFRLRLDPGGTRELVGAGFEPLELRLERINVRGGETEELLVKVSRHGPIVRETGGEALAMAWTALVGRSVMPAFLRLDRSRTVAEAAAAFADADAPGMNLIAADRAGHIGWQVVGRIPNRGRGAGRLPAPGWDSSWDWRGFEPYSANPSRFDPPQGFLATANHDPFAEGDFPLPGFAGEFAPPWRVRAIRAALAARADWDVPACLSLQMDDRNGQALAILDRLRPMLEHVGTPEARLLAGWDGRMDATSEAALVWAEFLRELTRRLSGEAARAAGLRGTPLGGQEILRLLEGRLDPSWWGGAAPGGQTPEQAVAAALEAASRRAAGASWGDRHRLLFEHPLGGIPLVGALLNRGPFPVAGAGGCIDATAYASQGSDFSVIALPSLRFVADLEDWDRAVFTLPLGQSGHFLSPHAADQTGDWLAGRAHPMPWSAAAVRAATVAECEVRP